MRLPMRVRLRTVNLVGTAGECSSSHVATTTVAAATAATATATGHAVRGWPPHAHAHIARPHAPVHTPVLRLFASPLRLSAPLTASPQPAAAAAAAATAAEGAAASASASASPFGLDSAVRCDHSFGAFLRAWTDTDGPFHPHAHAQVQQLAASAGQPLSPSPPPPASAGSSARPRPACVVGVSGGVDSAVTALLCLAARDAGVYSRVHAVHMRNWDEVEERGVCSGERDARDARRLCAALRLPLTEVDFSREYFSDVFQPLLDEYASGATPSPDVLCNRVIKFDLLLQHVRQSFGPDAVLATGHYARIRHTRRAAGDDSAGDAAADAAATAAAATAAASSTVAASSPVPPPTAVPPSSSSSSSSSDLLVALDPRKDQSYFLSSVPSSALRSCVFPLGQFHKTFVKQLARGEWAQARMRPVDADDADDDGRVAVRDGAAAVRRMLRGIAAEEISDEAMGGAAGAAHSPGPPVPSASSSSSFSHSSLSHLPRSRLAPASPLAALSSKKESMGICFIGKRPMRDFLAQYIPLHGGPFVDIESRRVVGQHAAWESWTVGQKAAISGARHKLYVCGKSAEQVQREGQPAPHDHPHAVFVCEGNHHPALAFDDLYLDEPQWIADSEPAQLAATHALEGVADHDHAHGHALSSMRVRVKVRSGGERVMATLWKRSAHSGATPDGSPAASPSPSPSASRAPAGAAYRIEFSSAQHAIAPGQCCVLYDESGQRCLGQGRIQRAGLSHWQKGQTRTSGRTQTSQPLQPQAEL